MKNKTAAPFREAEFDIMYGKGISLEGDLIDQAVKHEIIQKSGTWFSYGEERLGQGRDNVKKYLAANTDLRDKIEVQVREAVGLIEAAAPPATNNAAKKADSPANA